MPEEDPRRYITIIPAQPGLSLLQAWGERTEDPWFTHTPIIGWSVEVGLGFKTRNVFHFVLPITAEGDPTPDDHAILFPDGRVSVIEEAEFDTRAAWEDYIRKSRIARRRKA